MNTVAILVSAWLPMNEIFWLTCSTFVRSSLIVGLGWIAARFARRWSPSTSFAIWCAVMIVLLAQPLLSALAPPIAIDQSSWLGHILSSNESVYRATNRDAADSDSKRLFSNHFDAVVDPGLTKNFPKTDPPFAPQRNGPSQIIASMPTQIDASITDKSTVEHVQSYLPNDEERATTATHSLPNFEMAKEMLNRKDARQTPQNQYLHLIALCAALGYFVGVLWMALRMLLAWRKLRCVTSNSIALDQPNADLVADCATQIGIKALPQIAVSHHETAPFTWGWLGPVILLPASFMAWPLERRRAVLCHELAHVARRDAFWDWLSYLCRMIYWPHPLVHCAGEQMQRMREEATDDRVLISGFDPARYARQLVEIVTQRQLLPSASTAMSAGSLEARIKRIVSMTTGRRKTHRGIVGIFFVFSMLLAGMTWHITTSVAQAPAATGPGSAQTTDDRNGADDLNLKDRLKVGQSLVQLLRTAEVMPRDANQVPMSLHGTVRDRDGNPATDAMVVIINIDELERGERYNRELTQRRQYVLARTKTDDRGDYTLTYPSINIERRTNQSASRIILFALSENNSMGWSTATIASAYGSDIVDLVLRSTANGKVSGRLVSPSGEPVAGKLLAMEVLMTPEYFSGRMAHQSELCSLIQATLAPIVATDDDGKFEFVDLPSSAIAFIGDLFQTRSYPVRTSDDVPLGYLNDRRAEPSANTRLADDEMRKSHASPIEMVAPIRYRFHGSVTWDDGQPLAGCSINTGHAMLRIATDANGVFDSHVWLNPSSIPNFEEPNSTLTASLSCKGVYFGNGQRVSVPLSDLRAAQAIKIVRPRGSLVHGRVEVHGENVGLPHVKLTVMQLNSNSRRSYYSEFNPSAGNLPRIAERSIETDADGKFSVAGLLPGNYRIGVVGPLPGFRIPNLPKTIDGDELNLPNPSQRQTPRAYKDVTVVKDETYQLRTLEVDKLVPVELQVKDDQGVAIAGALVRWRNELTLTDQQGVAKLFAAPEFQEAAYSDTVVIYAHRAGMPWFGSARFVNGRLRVNRPLEPAWKVKGKVLLNGQPIEGAVVHAGDSDNPLLRPGVSGNASKFVPGFDGTVGKPGISDRNGDFELLVRPGTKFLFVPRVPGVPFLISGTGKRLDEPDATGWSQVELQLITGTETITGRIVNLSAEPVANARIRVQSSDSIYSVQGQNNRSTDDGFLRIYPPSEIVTTDTNGRFALTGLPPGKITLSIASSLDETRGGSTNSTSFEVEAGARDVELILPQPSMTGTSPAPRPNLNPSSPQRIEISPAK